MTVCPLCEGKSQVCRLEKMLMGNLVPKVPSSRDLTDKRLVLGAIPIRLVPELTQHEREERERAKDA